ncbi:HsdR family type I site-specific deoxyribonuclease [Marinobacterium sp. D7]|uniref:type I restriction endonuclease subunit R, EcoR124 family n=1 Tax=Marinobacterium ramblicola TaxID=2849041 RepID=UPI001C2D035C|nr:HsdR family type I site-specific deoxyribonuclease [Marinobacterium ramblicola]MBV1788445.1 HsdR family type I site-specific deoxyribonuclease [Marinobacterium ramblicola]
MKDLSGADTGLPADAIAAIQAVFARYEQIERAVLYGSRAKGNFRPGSDIDLTLYLKQEPTFSLLTRVSRELDELHIPWSIDLSLVAYIDNEKLLDHIRRVGIEFYNADDYRARQRMQEQRLEYAQSGIQSEAQLEESLILRLQGLGYERVRIDTSEQLKANLKTQLSLHNEAALAGTPLSAGEFDKVLNHLDKGNVFQRAKTLRDRYQLTLDDGSSCYLQFMNCVEWCRNRYQVTSQVTQVGRYENRYDVTLLINGLPLVQIELKRRGMELKEAFNQINRYQRHSFWAENGLYNYVQLFVISNGVNTKYYANNRKQEYKQTFFWSDEKNRAIKKLDAFTDAFLEPCHISKMIARYIVLHESDKILMALRPYQYYAVEKIVERVKEGRKNGYIWHTTGSGKTLTSFKAAQILTQLPKVHKVVFVVDRADLDYQTTKEFNAFSPDCVDNTDNTASLVKQMAGDNKLIVTTIQKLNNAISRTRHEQAMDALRDKRVVFIFDECHRSQFGQTHKNITGFFTKAQMFGFTGTPIFPGNAAANEHGKRTTADLFGDRLHQYVITDAIRDENVLKFAIEYWGKLRRKDGSLIDEQVHAINRKEFFESDERIEGVVNWIIANHNRKTYDKQFSAMMCVGSKEQLIKYYDCFKRKREAGEHDLRVVTIFTFGTNEEDADANGLIEEPDFDIKTDDPANRHSRDKLAQYVADYNALYKTAHSVKDSKAFYTYYKDIAKRMKERDKEQFKDRDRADILLVVNMFLTGFDAKKLNTLYVDKNLKHHGLIQAFSRTNRILGELKSQGNIVCFRNLKDNTDEAIGMFCDTDQPDTILMEPYEFYVEQFNSLLQELFSIAATPEAVDDLASEDDQALFVKAFRRLIRILNKLKPFTDFDWQDLELAEQTFEDFKSKYLDIHDRSRSNEPGASIIDDLDFELELIHRDEVNVAYTLKLLDDLRHKQSRGDTAESRQAMQSLLDTLGKEAQLRSKRELIEKFILDYMPDLTPEQDLQEIFVGFWSKERRLAVHRLCEREGLDKEAVYRMIDQYNFTGKDPLREQVFSAMAYKPKLMERKTLYSRVLGDLKEIIHTYDDDTGSLPLAEDPADYDVDTLAQLAHRIGDLEIFFTDEVARAQQNTPLVHFTIVLDTPYRRQLTSLQNYPPAGDLLGHGIVSDDVLTDYIALTTDFQQQLSSYGLAFGSANADNGQAVFWSLSEAREGSTVLEFVLNAWGYTVAVGGPVMAFLAAYPKAAQGLEKLRADVEKRFGRKGNAPESSVILTDEIAAELARIKRERN